MARPFVFVRIPGHATFVDRSVGRERAGLWHRSAQTPGSFLMRFELFIAARYLRAKRRQAVVGVITLISVIGVMAGVASLIIALAITNGMRRDLQEKLVGSTAHVMLMRTAGDGIRDWRPLLERLRTLPHVTAAAPGLYGQVLISKGARAGDGLDRKSTRLNSSHRCISYA